MGVGGLTPLWFLQPPVLIEPILGQKYSADPSTLMIKRSMIKIQVHATWTNSYHAHHVPMSLYFELYPALIISNFVIHFVSFILDPFICSTLLFEMSHNGAGKQPSTPLINLGRKFWIYPSYHIFHFTLVIINLLIRFYHINVFNVYKCIYLNNVYMYIK